MASTVTHALLDASELSDGQMKQVEFPGVEGGQVLLTKTRGQITATSAFCTHYGAPLSKGVLTPEGRVICPWHGACFNVCTGDIEDAPAPAGLHKFKSEIKDGKINVTANPDYTTKKNIARPPPHSDVQPGKGVVIVGGGSGAFHTVEGLRESGYKGSITILSKESYVPIDRTKLSKALITDPSKLAWRSPAELHTKLGTTIRLGVSVTSISLSDKSVTIDEKEHMTYDKLVISPGGIPRRLPIEGADFDNVYTFRDVEDSVKVDAAAQEGKRAVIIGSSFIGMELATVLSKRKLSSLHVVGMDHHPFEAVLGAQIGAGIQKFHESQGVKFHLKTKINKIVPSAPDGNTAGSVELTAESGEQVTLEADFIVLAVGVRPATDFMKGTFELEMDGGIKVDEFLRVPSVEDVYAIGDIAHYKQVETGQHKRIEHWNVAGNHGRAVAYNIVNAESPKAFDKVPVFWSAQGQQLRYCGFGLGYDDIFIRGDPNEMKFVAYYSKDGKIVAAASMQNDPVVMKVSELLRRQKMLTLDEIKSGKDPLEVAL